MPHKTIIVTAAIQSWASEFREIPATVIDNGVLRNVPYKSYRAGHDYEINIYGDPATPAAIEIGIRGGLLENENAKRNCITFICSLLREPADREAVHGLSLEKGKNIHDGLTFEVTPSSEPDAYGGWWVSVYNEDALNSVRASDKEMESITVERSSLESEKRAATSPESWDDWSSPDLRYARAPKSGGTGGSVYVRGYYRKNGTYVQSHTRSARRR